MKITSWRSWKKLFWGNSIIMPTLGCLLAQTYMRDIKLLNCFFYFQFQMARWHLGTKLLQKKVPTQLATIMKATWVWDVLFTVSQTLKCPRGNCFRRKEEKSAIIITLTPTRKKVKKFDSPHNTRTFKTSIKDWVRGFCLKPTNGLERMQNRY